MYITFESLDTTTFFIQIYNTIPPIDQFSSTALNTLTVDDLLFDQINVGIFIFNL